ncbi:MAG: DUF4330 domain-containing protein [Oscillospiraceae bacterium]|nr:DUF4330 domain-containing protein [Oscillospiraceae bacterium]
MEKNNETKKFTVIDFVIIAVTAAACAAVMFKFGIFEESPQNTSILFDVLITECEDNVTETVNKGDVVSISNKEKDTATVKDIRVEQSKTMTYNAQKGEYYMKELAEKSDLYITLEADADVTDTLIETGTTPVKVGMSMPVRGKGYALNGYIVRIEEN